MSRFTFCRFQSGFFFNTYTATHHTAHKMGLFILSQSKKVIALANLSFFLFVLFFLPTPMRRVILSFIVDLWSFLSLSLNSPVRSKYMTKSLTPLLPPPRPASLSQPVSGTLQRVFMPRDSESFHLLHNAAPPANVVSGGEERRSHLVPLSGWETKTVREREKRGPQEKKNSCRGKDTCLSVERFFRDCRDLFFLNGNF